MKTILLFLLLSSFATQVYAKEKGSYILDNNNECRIWDNKPKSNTSVAWDGAINEYGFCSGFGLASWFINDSFQVGYFGNMEDGRFNGLIRSFDLKGNYSKGHWVDGSRSADWKLIKDPKLKKLAGTDIESLQNAFKNASIQNGENPTKDESKDTTIGGEFLKGMAKEAGAQLVKQVFGFFEK